MSSELSPRELEVLRLAALGLTNQVIAARLSLSTKSIEHMLGLSDPYRGIYAKIGVTKRAEAVAWYTARFGCADDLTLGKQAANQLVEVLADYADRIYAIRLAGQPAIACEMARFIAVQAQQAGDRADGSPSQSAFYDVYVRALVEQGTAVLETSRHTEAVSRLSPIASELRQAAKLTANRATLGLATMLLAGAHNIDKRYQIGWKLGRSALKLPLSPDQQLRALRATTIAALYTANSVGVAWCEASTHALVEEGRFTNTEQLCETQEGVGRALGLMRMPGSDRWLEAAERSLDTIGHLPLRHLRLIQSRFEVACSLEGNSAAHIEQLGRQGLALAEQHGYPRHRDLIIETLEEALN